jgi:hypothetical protein
MLIDPPREAPSRWSRRSASRRRSASSMCPATRPRWPAIPRC